MRFRTLVAIVLLVAAGRHAAADQTTLRLYDGVTAFVVNPDGKDFTVSLDVRDINHRMHGPSELLVKVYAPDGKPAVREVIPDDGVLVHTSNPAAGGWDHEAWYYATCYSRGLEPLVRWSAFSDPTRLAALAKRTFHWKIAAGQPGVYRVVVVGSPDHYVTLGVDPDLPYALAGSPEWLHGHGDLFRRSFIYVPKTTHSIDVLFLQLDEPAQRHYVLKDESGQVLAEGDGVDGLTQRAVLCEGRYDDKLLTLEVSDGPGDFLINVTMQLDNDFKPVRAPHQAVTALFAPDAATARATQGGAIYHDDGVFWQMYQVRLYDWLKQLEPEDFVYPRELDDNAGFISVGSHNSPKPGSADRIMHSWHKHKNRQALNAAIREMLFGMRLIGHGDHVAIGPKRNLAYEQGCYTFFWYRPVWRILQQTDAPAEVKAALREFVIQAGDRLAFCRTMATGNGNAFGSLMEGLRYCYEATGDPLQKELFETCWERFTSGGYGDRVGIGPSGGLQESLGYDYHYGSYVLRGWKAVIADLNDERFIAARNRMLNLYSYIWCQEPGMPFSSRTSIPKLAGGTYDPWSEQFRWKGFGGPDFVTGVNDHNEWFAARRSNYYVVTYHGRLTPTWEGEGFHGQIGLGGGGICQLVVPSHGQVITAKPNNSYGGGMHLSQWRNFHVHSLVGTTADGLPLVTANSEHFNAKLEGETVTSSANVRQSSVRVERRYTFGPHAITCRVQLAPAQHDNVFSIWGGRPALRGKVTEAYEMIPFADLPKPKNRPRPEKGRTRLDVLAADGSVAGSLSDEPVVGAGVLIARGDYGALVELDRPRPIKLGQNDTILIELAHQLTPADEVALEYRIVPYAGEAPKLGDGAPPAAAARLLPQLEPADAPEQLPKLLADVPPLEIKGGQKQPIARVRLALSGEQLALVAQVIDDELVHHETAWRGSCLEVFGSRPGGTEIGHVFLVPQVDKTQAAAYVTESGKQIAASGARVSSSVTQNGYELCALLPLDLLCAASDDAEMLLEIQVSSRQGNERAHHTLFGSMLAYQNNTRYGLFKLKASADKEP